MRTLPLGAFDYIYVDGSHLPRDVLEDAVLAYRLLKVGALVTFDDYASDTNSAVRPKVALDAFVSVFGDAMTEVHRGWQLTLRREK